MEPIFASCVIAGISLVGVFVFGEHGHLAGTRRYIVPFAIGTFLGIAFFELIPETLEASEHYGAAAIVFGFLAFYVLAHVLGTFHHHHHDDADDRCESSQATAALLLIGDAVHNFVDGIVIASSFLVSPAAGAATTLGIALHEAPQEIAEYGVLRHAGYSRREAAVYNFLSATTVVFGAAVTLVLAANIESGLFVLTGIAAGNLLYVAMSDLIPDVHAATKATGRFFGTFASMLIGLTLIASLILWTHSVAPDNHAYKHGEAAEPGEESSH